MPSPRFVAPLLIAALGASLPGAGATAAPKKAAAAPARSWEQIQSDTCIAAVTGAEKRYSLPPGLLGTIAKVESGRPISGMGNVRAWPWTINADGQGYFFQSKEAAVTWTTQALMQGWAKFIDVGCMQVDLQMHPNAFRSLDEAFDPAINADYAARYLQQLQKGDAAGNWYVAVGLYHSHTPDRAAAYRDKVAQVGAGIVTGIGAPEPLYMSALRNGSLRLSLAGGGMMILHLNRQPAARPRRRLTACQIVAFLGSDLPPQARARGCPAGVSG